MIHLVRLCQLPEALPILREVPPAEDQRPLSAYGILTTWRKRFLGPRILTTWRKRFLGPRTTCPPGILRSAPVLE